MALATKCPQCGALFRVVADQLKLRGGLVRCGQCRAVFDAIGSLTYVDDSAVTQARTTTGDDQTGNVAPALNEEPSAARQATGPSTTLRIRPVAPATLAGGVPPRIEPLQTAPIEPAVIRRRPKPSRGERVEKHGGDDRGESPPTDWRDPVPTLATQDESQPNVPAGVPAVEGLRGDEVPDAGEPHPTPADTSMDEAAPEPPMPSFTRPQRPRTRRFSIVFGGGTALLALLVAIQLAVIFRGQLMIHWPQSRLILVELCDVFGCSVSWPTQADRLAVLGTELQSIPGTDVLELNAVIRNRAEFRQSLPAVEVTLTDASNRAIARKIFAPADYLASAGEPTARLQEGLAPGSDFTIRIFFEARGLAPAGFLVYPFYL